VSLKALKRDETTVLAYPHDYLIRPSVALYTADQLRAALAAQAEAHDKEMQEYHEFFAATATDIAERDDMIDALRAEVEALRRWKSTHAPRIEALQGLKDHAQQEAALGVEARTTLESERAANALLTDELEELRADAEHWRRIDSHGRYWLENRSGIIDCLTRKGYELLSSSSGWTLHKLPAARAAKGQG
jgi:hypothetical protein